MKKYAKNLGFTLTEMITVIAIVAALAVIVFGLTDKVQRSSKIKLTENTIGMVDNALSEFEQFGYQYRGADYSHLRFPIDCNDLDTGNMEDEISEALDNVAVSINAPGFEPDYAGSAAMCFFLWQVPQSRNILNEIDKSLLTSSKGTDYMTITVAGRDYPLNRLVDPWENPLLYSYYYNDQNDKPDRENPRSFPLVISAGPDGQFGTEDDIKNR